MKYTNVNKPPLGSKIRIGHPLSNGLVNAFLCRTIHPIEEVSGVNPSGGTFLPTAISPFGQTFSKSIVTNVGINYGITLLDSVFA